MRDIKELLDETARFVEAPPSPEAVEADVRRGRAALARRRRGRAMRFGIAAVVATALVGVPLVAGDVARDRSGPEQLASVRLVDYHGEQLKGFIVDQVPEGWYLQGSNAFRLTIAPEGDTTHPDAFIGKLVVFLLSASAPQELPKGDPVKVGGYDGVVTHTREADTLTYEDDAGHFVQVQAWRAALGWTNGQLVRFAEGVTVTADAKAGVG